MGGSQIQLIEKLIPTNLDFWLTATNFFLLWHHDPSINFSAEKSPTGRADDIALYKVSAASEKKALSICDANLDETEYKLFFSGFGQTTVTNTNYSVDLLVMEVPEEAPADVCKSTGGFSDGKVVNRVVKEQPNTWRALPRLRWRPEVTSDQTIPDIIIHWSDWSALKTQCVLGVRSKLSLIRPCQTEMTYNQTEIRPLSRRLCAQNYFWSDYYALEIHSWSDY